jgi:hypothetical protein
VLVVTDEAISGNIQGNDRKQEAITYVKFNIGIYSKYIANI